MDKEKIKKNFEDQIFQSGIPYHFCICYRVGHIWIYPGVWFSNENRQHVTGDILMYYRLHTEYKAGDMVVYQADGLLHIGRIAAVPEETVQITEEGELVINGYTQADTEVFYEKGPANGTEEQSLEKGNIIFWRMILPQRRTAEVMEWILRKQIKGIVVTLIRRRNL